MQQQRRRRAGDPGEQADQRRRRSVLDGAPRSPADCNATVVSQWRPGSPAVVRPRPSRRRDASTTAPRSPTTPRAAPTVHVVTCTLGEEGEVIGDRWAQLAVDHADQLGGYRIGELTAALHATGHRRADLPRRRRALARLRHGGHATLADPARSSTPASEAVGALVGDHPRAAPARRRHLRPQRRIRPPRPHPARTRSPPPPSRRPAPTTTRRAVGGAEVLLDGECHERVRGRRRGARRPTTCCRTGSCRPRRRRVRLSPTIRSPRRRRRHRRAGRQGGRAARPRHPGDRRPDAAGLRAVEQHGAADRRPRALHPGVR